MRQGPRRLAAPDPAVARRASRRLLPLLLAALALAGRGESMVPAPPGNRFALVVAVDLYADPQIPARADASGTAARLVALLKSRFGYEPARVIELPNARATTSAIYEALAGIRERIAPNDTLLVYLALQTAASSYRTRVGVDALIPSDGRLGERWTWIPVAAALETIGRMRARSTLVVLDGCLEAGADSGQSSAMPGKAGWDASQVAPKAAPAGQGIEVLWGCSSTGPPSFARLLVDELAKLDAPPAGKGRLTADELAIALRRSLRSSVRFVNEVQYERPALGFDSPFTFTVAPSDPVTAARSPDLATRRQAVAALGEALRANPGSPRAALAFRTLQGIAVNPYEDVELRMTAVAALRPAPEPVVAEALGQIISDGRTPAPVVTEALAVLEKSGGPSAIQELERALQVSEPATRAAAIRALTRLKSTPSAMLIGKALADPAPEVQKAALESIQALRAKDPSIVNGLLPEIARSHRDPNVRRSAVSALGTLGESSTIPVLVGFLTDPDAGVRSTAAYALARMPNARDFPPTASGLAAALGDGSGSVREAAAVALGRLKIAAAEAPLAAALSDSDLRVRAAAAEALGSLGDPGRVGPLTRALGDPSAPVRRAAALALRGQCDEAAQGALVQLTLREKDEGVAEAARAALGDCKGRPLTVQVPDWALASADAATRASALRELARRGDAESLRAIGRALGDPDRAVRDTAVELLGGSLARSPEALRVLEEALRSESVPARASAAAALGEMAPDGLNPLLSAASRETDPVVQAALVRALGGYADPRATSRIREVAVSAEDQVRLAAADALSAQSNALYGAGRYKEGLELADLGYETRMSVLGPEHVDVASDLNNIAVFQKRLGDLDSAQKNLERALSIRTRGLGEDDRAVAVSLTNLGALLKERRQYQQAEPLFVRALGIRERSLEPGDPLVVQSLENLASLYSSWGRKDEATRYLARAQDARSPSKRPEQRLRE